jgi:hypothetical protein
MFNTGGDGSGTGDGGSSGNQGQTDGDPNGTALDGLGKGNVGGRLEGRGGSGPSFKAVSQNNGRITIKVCANAQGEVISANRTQSNTTITNSTDIERARKAALKWKFKPGEEACGTLTFNIRVK